jgi:UDP-N-acetylglucosamine--N-acetylmuramyl-(pentapeptide) pyrophosphoryl-undecaprenol N-acetylglucosamine transferase
VLHLTGHGNVVETEDHATTASWRQVAFEDRMELFYAASDLVIARAGGGVAELTATATPSILVPGEFGSSGHQTANAQFLQEAGAALVLAQDRIGELRGLVEATIVDTDKLGSMRLAAKSIAKPQAAATIAGAMLELRD